MEFFIILVFVSAVAVIVIAIYDYWILPRIAKREYDRVVREYKEGKLSKHEPTFPSDLVVSTDVGGFTIANVMDSTIPVISRTWAEIERITAYKRDMLTVDLICLAVEFNDQQITEIDEDMAGWQAFVDASATYLAGCRPHSEWFGEVAFPAFVTNTTIVFARKQEAGVPASNLTAIRNRDGPHA